MKILMINNLYQQFGSTEAISLAEKKLLEDYGHQVLLYTRDNNEIKTYSAKDKLLFPINAVYSLRTQREIAQIVQDHRPDVAYVHNFLPLISPSVYHTLHSLGVPTVQVLHEFRFFCANSHFYTRGQICERCKGGNYMHAVRYRCYQDSYLASFACASLLGINRAAGFLDKLSAFICLTEFSKQKLIEIGLPPNKLFVRPHSIEASHIEPRFGQGQFILFLGRLSEEKGLMTLIRAVSNLPEVTLKIAGTGPLENDLRAYVKARYIRNVDFVGLKNGPEKWDLLQQSLFVVVPSEWYETFCMVVIESFAAGKPVVGSNLGSLPYVIENGKSGLLFEPGNVDDLREKIEYLLARPETVRLMGRNGRQSVDTKYRPEENYQALMRIFNAVTS